MSYILQRWKKGGRDVDALDEFQAKDLKEEARRLKLVHGGSKGDLLGRIDGKYAELYGRNPSPPPSSPSSASEEEAKEANSPPRKLVKKASGRAEASSSAPSSTNFENRLRKRLAWYLSGKAGFGEAESEDAENRNATDFCCHFELDTAPKIRIQDNQQESSIFSGQFFEISKFPCDEETGKKLVALSTQAPFGRGEETLMDKAVRDGLQIDREKIKFDNAWLNLFSDSKGSELLRKIRGVLSPRCRAISARFYKLLIYPKGSFFKPHLDTQREPHHFGSVVVFLPSPYSGGELVIQHGADKRKFAFGLAKGSAHIAKCNVVAFFADCLHEVLPVTSGYRLTLTYQLFYEGPVAPELPMSTVNLGERIARNLDKLFSLKKWRKKTAGWLLEHRYALASVKVATLKGADRTVYDALSSTGRFEVTVIPVKIEVTGTGWDDMAHQTAAGYYSELLFNISDEGLHFQIRQMSAEDEAATSKAGKKKQAIKLWNPKSKDDLWLFGSSSSSSKYGSKGVGELLSEFTYFPNGYEETGGDAIFLNDFRQVTIGDIIDSREHATGNTGTEFELRYCKAAFLIKPKTS